MSNVVYEPSQTTHWKNLFPKKSALLGSHNLNAGEELVAQITGVSVQEIKNNKGKADHVPVVTFSNAPPFVLNITNARTIESLYGCYHQNWIGKHIQLYATEVKDFGGGKTMGLRVRPKAPVVNDDLGQYESSLRKCQSMKELQGVFMSIPKQLKPSLEALKNEMKGKLNV